MIRFDGVSHTYGSARHALRNVTLHISAGERVALVGPSGAGKSTFLRCINGLVTPEAGTVTTLGTNVSSLPESEKRSLRRQVGMIFQEFALVERLSVLNNVLVGRLGYVSPLEGALGRFGEQDRRIAMESVQSVGLAGYEERPVRRLSGGQKQRVGIARALAQGAKIVLGDEPTANLDIRTADTVLKLLVELSVQRETTLVLSLHDVQGAKRHCTRIIGLCEGRVVWDGPAQAFDDAAMETVFYAETQEAA